MGHQNVTHIACSHKNSTYYVPTTPSINMSSNSSTAIVLRDDDRPTDAVRDTMQYIVSDNTIVTYHQENTKFILYLYDLDADEFILGFRR